MNTASSIEDVAPADLDAVLALNNLHAQELSLLDRPRLARLVAEAFCARRVGALDAFLIAFDQDARYDSPNFLWFTERLPRFVYIDRVAVAEEARGRGLARALYADLFARAEAAGHDVVVCEVNAVPPNPASDGFHAALGFVAMGSGTVAGGAKAVRYFRRALG